MDWLAQIADYFLHLDRHMGDLIRDYGTWTYGILFAVIFAETGLVVAPFLPGDSLLFAAGLFAHPDRGSLDPLILFGLLAAAAILGDAVNYHVGKYLGRRMFRVEEARFLKKSHLDRTHAFFERYGGKTIVIARFVPIVRTFAPFVAGLGTMTYGKFLFYNVFGAFLWVGVCVGAGYYFGGLAVVRDNFTIAILVIVFLSILPAIVEMVRHRLQGRARPAAATESD